MSNDRQEARADAAAEKARTKAMRPWWKKKRFLIPLALVAIIAISAAASGGSKDDTATPAKSDTSAEEVADTTPEATAAPAAPVVLLDLQGSGTKTTQKFTAPDDWDLEWSYDCSNFPSQGGGNFIVSSSGVFVTPVNQLGKSGQGVEHYHDSGTLYLEVNSECNWHITAKTA